MANIFISYSRHREAVAKTLAADLENLGHAAWFDQALTGGQAWWDQILAQVRNCAVFVFVLDPDSLDSTACQREYSYAADLGKPILPVLVEDGISTNLLPPVLAQIQFVDYRIQDRNAAFRLAKAVSALPVYQGLPEPLPAPPVVPVSYLGSLAERIEGSTALSYEDQSVLLVDLKRSLRDPKSMKDSRTLLERLRKRRDLFANIAEEIDDVIRSAPSNPVVSLPIPDTEPPIVVRQNSGGFGSAAVAQLDQREVRSLHAESAVADSGKGPSLFERVRSAITQGLTGAGFGILCLAIFSVRWGPYILSATLKSMAVYNDFLPWYLFAIGGAVAGAISGRERTKIIGAQVGMAFALALVCLVPFTSAPPLCVSGVVAPPLGTLVSAYLAKRKISAAETTVSN